MEREPTTKSGAPISLTAGIPVNGGKVTRLWIPEVPGTGCALVHVLEDGAWVARKLKYVRRDGDGIVFRAGGGRWKRGEKDMPRPRWSVQFSRQPDLEGSASPAEAWAKAVVSAARGGDDLLRFLGVSVYRPLNFPMASQEGLRRKGRGLPSNHDEEVALRLDVLRRAREQCPQGSNGEVADWISLAETLLALKKAQGDAPVAAPAVLSTPSPDKDEDAPSSSRQLARGSSRSRKATNKAPAAKANSTTAKSRRKRPGRKGKVHRSRGEASTTELGLPSPHLPLPVLPGPNVLPTASKGMQSAAPIYFPPWMMAASPGSAAGLAATHPAWAAAAAGVGAQLQGLPFGGASLPTLLVLPDGRTAFATGGLAGAAAAAKSDVGASTALGTHLGAPGSLALQAPPNLALRSHHISVLPSQTAVLPGQFPFAGLAAVPGLAATQPASAATAATTTSSSSAKAGLVGRGVYGHGAGSSGAQ